jgi:hypothetical protein
MKKVLIDDLVNDKWACPFDVEVLEYLIASDDTLKYIQQFAKLCEVLEIEFSSPGNSFDRKLINILNRKYIIERFTGPCTIRKKCESNKELISIYDNIVDKLRTSAVKIKFRKCKTTNTKFIEMTDKEILSTFKSDVLNDIGIIATHKTFL